MNDQNDRMAAARAARAAKREAELAAETPRQPVPHVEPTTVPDNLATTRALDQRATAEAATVAVEPEARGTNNERVANKLANEAAMRERAARQRVASGGEEAPEMVKVRITKAGGGKISMGQHVPGVGEAHYEWKEEPTFPEPIAKALEDRGFVEIL